jgi:hypothetical protein
LVVPLAAVSALAMLGACVEFYSFDHPPDDYDAGTGGKDGAGGGTGGGMCAMPEDCGEATVCGTPVCNAGMCSWTGIKSEGETPPELMNVAGDCKKIQCDGDGEVETLDTPSEDMFSYGDPCYKADCGGGLVRPPVDFGAVCNVSGHCFGNGNCMECATDAHCSSGRKCDDGKCALDPQCFNNAKDGMETDVDCGGPCGPCNDGQNCGTEPDFCKSGVCINGTCRMPECGDFVKNADETDNDCGGSCKPCASTKGCLIHADCANGECSSGKCK